MADNNSTNRDDQANVADDDPFAELARIMNQGSPAKPSAPSEEAAAAEEAAAPDELAAELPAPEETDEADPFAVDLEKELLGDLDEVDAAYAHEADKPSQDIPAEEYAAADTAPSHNETAGWQDEDAEELPPEPEPENAEWDAASDDLSVYTEAVDDGMSADAEPLAAEPAEMVGSESDAGYGGSDDPVPADTDDSVLADVDMDFGDLDAPMAADSEPEPEDYAPAEEHDSAYEEVPAPVAEEEASQPVADAAGPISLEDELEMLLADGSPSTGEPAEAAQPAYDEHSSEDAAFDDAFPEPEQQSSIFTRANYVGGGEQDYSGQDMTADDEPLDDYDHDYAEPQQPEAAEEHDPFAELAAVSSETAGDAQDLDGAEEASSAGPDIPFEFETVDVPEPATVQEDDLPLPDLPADDFVARDLADDFEPGLDFEFASASRMPEDSEAVYSDEPQAPGTDNEALNDEDRFYAEALGFGTAASAAHGFEGRADGGQAAMDSGLDRDLEEAIAQPDAFAIPPQEKPARRNGVMIAGVVLGVAILGGIGAFALSSGGDDDGAPVLVEADNEPMKVKPADPGGSDQPLNQDSVAYEAATGAGGDEQPQQESLVTTTEEPVNLASRVVDTERLPGVDDAQLAADDDGASGKVEDRLEATAPATQDEVSDQVIAVQPRKVRTMVVRPDGTLVPREEAAAVETAAAPEPTAMETATASQPEETIVEPVITAEEPVAAEEPTIAAVQSDENETQAAAATTDTNDAIAALVADETPATEPTAAGSEDPVTPAVAPVATSRPASQPAAEPRQVAQAAPVVARAEPAAPEPVATASSEWSMQIASQPSAESAQATYQELARRYGSLLDGRGVNIVRAEIDGKGTYYRVRIPMASRSDGIDLCERYKAAGGSCFVSK